MSVCQKKSKKVCFLIFVNILALLAGLYIPKAIAKDCEDIEDDDDRIECYQDKEEETKRKLDETKNKINNTLANIQQLSGQLTVTQSELNQVQNSINEIINELDIINQNLDETYKKLEDKIDFRNKVLRNYSKKSSLNNIELFFSTKRPAELSGFQFASFVYAFNKATTEETLNVISALNAEIRSYENDKAEAVNLKEQLELTQNNLIALKNDLAVKKEEEENVKGDLEEKKTEYEEELEELQDKIIELKYGSGNWTVGTYEAPSAKTPDPPFKPAFAAFSYGAYTHYKGMSQYGAKGRAEDDQDYKDILKFYYDSGVKDKGDLGEICVEGIGNIDFDKYLYGIAEMPSSWPMDALKAQAIAARSYAYRYKEAGKCICTTQSCQVFLKSKSDNPPDRWKDAVDDTEGEILDSDTVAYYSASTGGFIENIGWDVDGDWPGDAYEKKADSPWFRKAWYTKSYNDSSSCGHGHPWLDEEEMADILNSYVVYTKGSDKDSAHISPLTTDCWGGDPYSMDKMKDKAADYGTGYDRVTDINVKAISNGQTREIEIKTNKGTVTVDGQTFKTVYNLRAPGYVAIRSRLFDFEKED